MKPNFSQVMIAAKTVRNRATGAWNSAAPLFAPFRPRSVEALDIWRLLMCSAVVGVAGGLGAIFFYRLLTLSMRIFLGGIAGYRPMAAGVRALVHGATEIGPTRRWLLLVLPALGGWASGWLVLRFAPEAEGHGTDAVIKAYHHHDGFIRARVPLIKALASAVTIGTGGSAGAEGPIAQIGAGLASMLARAFRLNAAQSRILMAAGVGAGVGAIFRAPTAGALFAAEVLYRDMDMEFEVIIPSVIASIMGYSVFVLVMGSKTMFVTPDLTFLHPLELIPYLLMAFVLAGGAFLFIRVFYGIRDIFVRLPFRPIFKPIIGGVIVGIIGWHFPQTLSQGYGVLQRALVQGTELESILGTVSLRFLLGIFVFKTLTTAFSVGSGGSGGIFGPSLVIGGALGGACGLLAARWFPGLQIQPGAFALVGMAGFFAAMANAPICTILMVSEISGNYNLLMPSMWVSILAYVLLRRHSIYENQIINRLTAPIHQGSMTNATLRNISVAEALRRLPTETPMRINSTMTADALMKLFAAGTQSSFPVLDSQDHLIGIVRQAEIRAIMQSGNTLWTSLIAADLAVAPVVVFPGDNLLETIRKMTENNVEEVLVVAAEDPRKLMGMITHQSLTNCYTPSGENKPVDK